MSYDVFISVGIQGLITGIVQIAKPEWVVEYVHWPFSTYFLEPGMANASYGIIGLLTVLMDTGWKNAAAAGYALFLFATGIGHIVDYDTARILQRKFRGFLLTDLVVPLILFIVT